MSFIGNVLYVESVTAIIITCTKHMISVGSLLFSKPQTEACTTTADIGQASVIINKIYISLWMVGMFQVSTFVLSFVQLLWTIIRYQGNS